MRKITVYINDETAKTFDMIAQSQTYYGCSHQAYGLIIDEIVSELSRISKTSISLCCSKIVAKKVADKDLCFCCSDLKQVVAEAELGSLITVYERCKETDEWVAVCPYCHTELAVNKEGMITGVVKEK